MSRLFFQADRPAGSVEFHDAITFRVFDPIAEDSGSFATSRCFVQEIRQSMAIENIVAERQRYICATDEFFGDKKSLGDTLGLGLHRVFEAQAPFGAVAEQALEAFLLM